MQESQGIYKRGVGGDAPRPKDRQPPVALVKIVSHGLNGLCEFAARDSSPGGEAALDEISTESFRYSLCSEDLEARPEAVTESLHHESER